MTTTTNSIRVTLTTKDMPTDAATLTASGSVLDILAKTAGEYEQYEMYTNNLDYFSDCIKAAFDGLDMESIFIDYLNENPAKLLSQYGKAHNPCDLKAGACFALHFTEDFDKALAGFRGEQEAAMYDCVGDYSGCIPAIAEALQADYDILVEDQHKEWLYGDHRKFAGVLAEIAKYFGAEDCDIENNNHDAVVLTFTRDQAFEALNSPQDENPTITNSELAELLKDSIQNSIIAACHKHEQEQAARKTEQDRLIAYKAEQQASATTKRSTRLLAMTK